MSRSFEMRRGGMSQRWKRVLAASLCAGSFLTGSLLFGAENQLRPASNSPVNSSENSPVINPYTASSTSSSRKNSPAPTPSPAAVAKTPAKMVSTPSKLKPTVATAAEPATLPQAEAVLAPIVKASDMQRRPGVSQAPTLAPIVKSSRPALRPTPAADEVVGTGATGLETRETLPTPASIPVAAKPVLAAPKPIAAAVAPAVNPAAASDTAAAVPSRSVSPWMQELDAPRPLAPHTPEVAPQPIPSAETPRSLATETPAAAPRSSFAEAAERATELLETPAPRTLPSVEFGRPKFEPLAEAMPTIPPAAEPAPVRSSFIPVATSDPAPAPLAIAPAPTREASAAAPMNFTAPIAAPSAAPTATVTKPVAALPASAPIASVEPSAPQQFTAENPQQIAPVISSVQARLRARQAAEARTLTPYSQSIAPVISRPGYAQPGQTRPAALVQPEPIGPARVDMIPEGSPFEVIDESGVLTVRVRRSRLLRTKVDIYRTAVVDESICDVVQFTPREVSIIGKSQGATHVTFWFDDPNSQPLTWLVKVEPDAEEVKKEEQTYKLLQDVINEMFPDSKIELVVVASKLIVRGQAKDSEEAAQIISIIRAQTGGQGQNGLGGGQNGLGEGAAADVLSDSATGNSSRSRLQVINMLRVPGVHQVALKVKIAELNRTAARGFGVDLKTDISFSESEKGSSLLLESILNMAGGQAPALLTQIDGDEIQIGIRYLQQHGVVKLLAEPTLVTLSGRPATFIAGGEFAVPTVVGSAGLNAVTTDFRAFGAIISFMPTVVDKDRIRLEVAPEFSQINQDLNVGGTPGLRVRAATTTVEMREGQTLAIAGLLEDNMNGTTIGDLPFLAKIFGRRGMQRNETELLILVSPELVHPMEPEEVPPLPGFDVTEPTNGQFFLHGDLEGNPTQDYRSTVWPRLRKRYGSGGPSMTSGPFGHGQ
ncbi:type II and III secretion system protein [Pirellula staleyi DSM 6068]|uniref:Type II and III secretion system protein n=1 Tax=Pirellula staleyi (strain ATCC 27377 / DSM 6068 / ICPB 4128) TaxID=530564 RepID=D2QWX8_PIRSD|nr:type II and III secretion system protein [Pirellula staleyi DSM 6068]